MIFLQNHVSVTLMFILKSAVVSPQFPVIPMAPMAPMAPMSPMAPMAPMSPMAPMIPMPPPFIVPIVEIPLNQFTTTTTTTTTTEASKVNIAAAVAFPIPMPMPVQIAVPAMLAPSQCQNKPRPRNCPPCPPCNCYPSCTPSFFSYCSPCHLKCRCRNPDNAPVPLPPRPPMPMYPGGQIVVQPPALVLPLSKDRKYKRYYDDSSSCDTSDSGCYRRERRKRRGRRDGAYRRRSVDIKDNEMVQPVLTYLSKSGEVKFQKRIDIEDADELLDEKRKHKKKRNS